MNILIPDSWLREYLITDASPKDIQKGLSLCGPSVERTVKTAGDVVYDIEVTTNRVDCMSVYGIAREAAAILPQFGFTARLKPLLPGSIKSGTIPGFTIDNNSRLCQRILALKLEGIKVEPSPKWLQDRLNAVGQRPLNNLVDITNYVMWETGHPCHVFDFDRLTTHQMLIREALKGEQITTLDNKTYVLAGGEVVIDDGTGNIIDLPSVMGTANSVVVENTTSALLFVDDVDHARVRFASMTHAIRTQAATLLEKDINPATSLLAMSRMLDLITQIYPGVKISRLIDLYPHPQKSEPVTLPLGLISRLIGQEVGQKQVLDILTRLDFQVSVTGDILTVIPPPWRQADIRLPEDVVEEVARIYGYHNIQPVLMSGPLPPPDHNSAFYWENRIRTALKYFNFTEIYTYSLVARDDGLKLKNPLTSEWVYLRTSLFPSHRQVISQNLGKADTLNFYEIANVYLPRKHNLPVEQSRLIVTTTDIDYYKFKGRIESLLKDIGVLNLTPRIISDSGIFYWEIALSELLDFATDLHPFTPISKFTPIFEDVNLPYTGNYAQTIKKLYSLSPLIKNIELKDKFDTKLTLKITYHSDIKQLSSVDIAPIREKLTKAL